MVGKIVLNNKTISDFYVSLAIFSTEMELVDLL